MVVVAAITSLGELRWVHMVALGEEATYPRTIPTHHRPGLCPAASIVEAEEADREAVTGEDAATAVLTAEERRMLPLLVEFRLPLAVACHLPVRLRP